MKSVEPISRHLLDLGTPIIAEILLVVDPPVGLDVSSSGWTILHHFHNFSRDHFAPLLYHSHVVFQPDIDLVKILFQKTFFLSHFELKSVHLCQSFCLA